MYMKLHVACGSNILQGYVNIDLYSEDRRVLKLDYTEIPDKFSNVDEIYSCHFLEHLDPSKIRVTLKQWYDMLKPGGVLRIAVPDFGAIVEHYSKYGDLWKVHNMCFGIWDDYGGHYQGFDEKKLTDFLERAGFKEIKRFESEFNDLSNRSHNGILMSLNMEGTKKDKLI